ncbi:MAG: NAD-dependent isocitrate dehydrogenase, partial [Gammaproteobacteria bacterium]|nr:NAD-dependent isocitrate dehydrogenase [Gammaproteobacteria bacterium]
MSTKITVIPGDGIGPEIMKATLKCMDALDCDFDYEYKQAGLTALDESGELIPQETLDSIRENRVVLKGPLTTPVGGGFRSINVSLRKAFDLYANVRPVISM